MVGQRQFMRVRPGMSYRTYYVYTHIDICTIFAMCAHHSRPNRATRSLGRMKYYVAHVVPYTACTHAHT